MSIKYVTVSIYELNTEYVAKVIEGYEPSIEDRALIYSIKRNVYFTSSTAPQKWYEDVICHTQDDFIQTIEQYRLLKLLNQ